jgi:hypothetical protein
VSCTMLAGKLTIVNISYKLTTLSSGNFFVEYYKES